MIQRLEPAGCGYRNSVPIGRVLSRRGAKTALGKYKNALNEQSAFGRPSSQKLLQLKPSTLAEKYHDNYFKDNPNAGYCRAIIRPKMKKFRKAFAEKLKKDDDQ